MLVIFYGSQGGFYPYTRQQANITINGTASDGNHFGAIFLLDDFNNDSYKDILASAYQQNISYGSHDETGQTYIFYGNSNGFQSTTADNANVTLNGTLKKDYFGFSLAVANSIYSHKMFAIGIIGHNLSGMQQSYTGKTVLYALNFPPSLTTIPNQSWTEDISITINISQYISDVNNDNPNYTWTSPADISVSVDEATNVVTLAPNANWYGTEYIVFYANDTFNSLVASNNVTLAVSNTADCGDAACDSSETCVSCSADCGACAPVAGSAAPALLQSVHIFADIQANTPETAEFTGLAVNSIEFTVSEEISNAKISVKEAELPSSTIAPQGEVKSYIEIDAPKLVGKLKEAKIKFSVEKKWLEENGFAADEVVLQRFADNAWRELTTSKLSEDSSKVYYEAVTPGFSLFAITAKKAVEEEVVEEVKEEIEEGAVEEPKAPEAPVIVEKQSHAWLYMLGIAVLAVIAAAFLFGAKRHKEKKRRR